MTQAYRDGWERIFGAKKSVGERSEQFNNTTGALSWKYRSATLHPDRCICQNEVIPHKHYSEPPYACARCNECKAYSPAV